jgi:hypothetical protein
MSSRADSIPLLGQATRTTSGNSANLAVGEYLQGQLWIYLRGKSGTGASITPRWQWSPNATYGTGGSFVTLKAFSAAITATGLAVLTLPPFGKWGRLNYTLAGSGPNVNFSAYFVGKGSY